MKWYLGVLKKYAVFDGRARRKEYWMFFLFNLVISFVLVLIEGIALESDVGVLSIIYDLAVLIPGLAVGVRRLHDTNHRGWWLFISLVPLVGTIVLIVYMVSDSQWNENKYGPNPKAVRA